MKANRILSLGKKLAPKLIDYDKKSKAKLLENLDRAKAALADALKISVETETGQTLRNDAVFNAMKVLNLFFTDLQMDFDTYVCLECRECNLSVDKALLQAGSYDLLNQIAIDHPEFILDLSKTEIFKDSPDTSIAMILMQTPWGRPIFRLLFNRYPRRLELNETSNNATLLDELINDQQWATIRTLIERDQQANVWLHLDFVAEKLMVQGQAELVAMLNQHNQKVLEISLELDELLKQKAEMEKRHAEIRKVLVAEENLIATKLKNEEIEKAEALKKMDPAVQLEETVRSSLGKKLTVEFPCKGSDCEIKLIGPEKTIRDLAMIVTKMTAKMKGNSAITVKKGNVKFIAPNEKVMDVKISGKTTVLLAYFNQDTTKTQIENTINHLADLSSNDVATKIKESKSAVAHQNIDKENKDDAIWKSIEAINLWKKAIQTMFLNIKEIDIEDKPDAKSFLIVIGSAEHYKITKDKVSEVVVISDETWSEILTIVASYTRSFNIASFELVSPHKFNLIPTSADIATVANKLADNIYKLIKAQQPKNQQRWVNKASPEVKRKESKIVSRTHQGPEIKAKNSKDIISAINNPTDLLESENIFKLNEQDLVKDIREIQIKNFDISLYPPLTTVHNYYQNLLNIPLCDLTTQHDKKQAIFYNLLRFAQTFLESYPWLRQTLQLPIGYPMFRQIVNLRDLLADRSDSLLKLTDNDVGFYSEDKNSLYKLALGLYEQAIHMLHNQPYQEVNFLENKIYQHFFDQKHDEIDQRIRILPKHERGGEGLYADICQDIEELDKFSDWNIEEFKQIPVLEFSMRTLLLSIGFYTRQLRQQEQGFCQSVLNNTLAFSNYNNELISELSGIVHQNFTTPQKALVPYLNAYHAKDPNKFREYLAKLKVCDLLMICLEFRNMEAHQFNALDIGFLLSFAHHLGSRKNEFSNFIAKTTHQAVYIPYMKA